jgi:lipoprotein signal peptidase
MKARMLFLLLAAVVCCALSWGALPILYSLDVWVIENPKAATPFHLLGIWGVAFIALWITAGVYSPVIMIALGAMIGGATSNILYRLIWGPVPDYIALPMNAYGNIADMMIFIGAPVYMGLLVYYYAKARRANCPAVDLAEEKR